MSQPLRINLFVAVLPELQRAMLQQEYSPPVHNPQRSEQGALALPVDAPD